MASETKTDGGIYMEGMDGKVYRAFPEGWRELLDPIEAETVRQSFPWNRSKEAE